MKKEKYPRPRTSCIYLSLAATLCSCAWLIALIKCVEVDRLFPGDSRIGGVLFLLLPLFILALTFEFRALCLLLPLKKRRDKLYYLFLVVQFLLHLAPVALLVATIGYAPVVGIAGASAIAVFAHEKRLFHNPFQ